MEIITQKPGKSVLQKMVYLVAMCVLLLTPQFMIICWDGPCQAFFSYISINPGMITGLFHYFTWLQIGIKLLLIFSLFFIFKKEKKRLLALVVLFAILYAIYPFIFHQFTVEGKIRKFAYIITNGMSKEQVKNKADLIIPNIPTSNSALLFPVEAACIQYGGYIQDAYPARQWYEKYGIFGYRKRILVCFDKNDRVVYTEK